MRRCCPPLLAAAVKRLGRRFEKAATRLAMAGGGPSAEASSRALSSSSWLTSTRARAAKPLSSGSDANSATLASGASPNGSFTRPDIRVAAARSGGGGSAWEPAPFAIEASFIAHVGELRGAARRAGCLRRAHPSNTPASVWLGLMLQSDESGTARGAAHTCSARVGMPHVPPPCRRCAACHHGPHTWPPAPGRCSASQGEAGKR